VRAYLALTANVINPEPVDTGSMSDEIKQAVLRQTPLDRLGTPEDTANLVEFLCSPGGGWFIFAERTLSPTSSAPAAPIRVAGVGRTSKVRRPL
jgi:NAD(P)-dependent dehydrogenase (short-subunit alcohol dehydrogenase family)